MFLIRALVGFCFAIGLGGAAADEKECAWSDVERIVAVGDVHGDYGQFVRALRLGKVIDEAEEWAGGRTHLVQIGDVLDRGPDSRRSMDLLMKLEGQAGKAGGRVHALIGNHEALILAGQRRYQTAAELASFGGLEGLRKAMEPDGTYGRWIRGHNAVIRINEILFAHGGLAPGYAGKPLKEINDGIRGGLGRDSGDFSGPLWYRGLAEGREDALEKQLKPVLEGVGAARIIVGHTVAKGGIAVRGGGLVVMIDVGMSRVYKGPAACLVIERGKYTAVYADGARELPVRAAKGGKPSGFRGPLPRPVVGPGCLPLAS